jgi:hypothetical protein
MQRDIDEILVLNGKKNQEGRVVCDTTTKLIAKRRIIYQSFWRKYEKLKQ